MMMVHNCGPSLQINTDSMALWGKENKSDAYYKVKMRFLFSLSPSLPDIENAGINGPLLYFKEKGNADFNTVKGIVLYKNTVKLNNMHTLKGT